MMWEVIMAIGALSVVSLLLWFVYPMINLTILTTQDYVDQDDPINQFSLQMGNAFFLVLGLVGFLVTGFLLYSNALKSDL
jgi:hypothetical protein